MSDRKWIALEELRQPGMRRILEGMKSIKAEAPVLVDDASIPAKELSKSRAEGGHALQ
jgi:hypothetical protein